MTTENPILRSTFDLIKYHVVSKINTGDKTLDNLINGLFLSCLGILYSYFLDKFNIYTMIGGIIVGALYYYRNKVWEYISKFSLNNTTTKIVEEKKNDFEIVHKNINKEFITKRKEPFNFAEAVDFWSKGDTVFPYIVKFLSVYYNINDVKDLKNISTSSTDSIKIFWTDKNTLIEPYSGNGVAVRSHVHIATALTDINLILAQFFNSQTNDCHKIYGIERNNIIYKDKTFDFFISKHKTQIINKLKNVSGVLNGKFNYNGYDHYNFGMILHGLPGTGKTVLCKMIANYMNRDIYIVNMKTIKTCAQFHDLFWSNKDLYKYQKYVYVLDEFDCVQGALSRSSSAEIPEVIANTEYNNENKIKELRKEYINILTLKSQTRDNEIIDRYTQECKKIQDDIDAITTKLDIYTLLSTFDGIEEMRGRVIIATTNYIDRIDTALLRPGRFDIKINLGAFERSEIIELLENMFEGKMNEKDKELLYSAKFQENTYTPADIMNIVFTLEKFESIITQLCLPKRN